jgi:hypothetical protein
MPHLLKMENKVGNMAMIFRALPTLKLNSCKKANSQFDLREFFIRKSKTDRSIKNMN